MSLIIHIENKMPGYSVVTLNGRLDGNTYADCEDQLAPLLIPATKTLIFDLSHLDYISSMGLRIVIKTRKYIESSGGGVHVINLQPQIEHAFEIANLLPGMTRFANMKDADDYYGVMQKKV